MSADSTNASTLPLAPGAGQANPGVEVDQQAPSPAGFATGEDAPAMTAFLARPRVLLFANTDWYLYNFRLALIERLQAAGADVVLASPPGPYAERLTKRGYRHVPIPFDPGSRGGLSNLKLLWRVWRLFRTEKPRLAHFFTIKCVLLGGLIARLHGTPRVLAVTGLGHLFTDTRKSTRLLRALVSYPYRLALGGKGARVVFQNPGNRDEFRKAKLIPCDGGLIIQGSGVDCTRFKPSQLKRTPGPTRLLFASRLLVEKGLRELCSAVQTLNARGADLELTVAGAPYPGNPSSLSDEEVSRLSRIPGIQFIGHVEDTEALLHVTDIVVLPSYAEGCPRILIEAAAAAKPIVATNVPGCLGIVQDGVNGILCAPRCTATLITALESMLIRRPNWPAMGQAGRALALEAFSEQTVNHQTIHVYAMLIVNQRALQLVKAS